MSGHRRGSAPSVDAAAVAAIARRVQRVLGRHGWPAVYALGISDRDGCAFAAFRLRGASVTAAFRETLRLVCEVEARRSRVVVICIGCRLTAVPLFVQKGSGDAS